MSPTAEANICGSGSRATIRLNRAVATTQEVVDRVAVIGPAIDEHFICGQGDQVLGKVGLPRRQARGDIVIELQSVSNLATYSTRRCVGPDRQARHGSGPRGRPSCAGNRCSCVASRRRGCAVPVSRRGKSAGRARELAADFRAGVDGHDEGHIGAESLRRVRADITGRPSTVLDHFAGLLSQKAAGSMPVRRSPASVCGPHAPAPKRTNGLPSARARSATIESSRAVTFSMESSRACPVPASIDESIMRGTTGP